MMLDPKELERKLKQQNRIAEENDAKRRADELGVPYLDLISTKVPTEVRAMYLVPEARARKARLVPLQLLRKRLMLATFDPRLPDAKEVIENLKKTHGCLL